MSRSRPLVRFGWRFLACLVVLGGVYVLLFHPLASGRPAIRTTTKQLAAVRTALDESYIADHSLAGFSQSGAGAPEALDALFSQSVLYHKQLAAAIKAVPAVTIAGLSDRLAAITTRQQQAASAFSARYPVLRQVIQYDPSTDLGLLSVTQSAADLTTRAKAAQQGLLKAAANQSTVGSTAALHIQSDAPLVDAQTVQLLQREAGCFGQLAAVLGSNQAAAAMAQRSQCIDQYPALRGQAIHNVVIPAYGGAYDEYLKQTVPAVLKTLDQQIKTSL